MRYVFKCALCSAAIPCLPDEENKNGNHDGRNEHPVLGLESQNSEAPSQEIHGLVPFLCKARIFRAKRYYFYTYLRGALRRRRGN
jgi:hypothetical protein